jgi:hypothetical protein
MKVEEYLGLLYPGYGHTCTLPPNLKTSIQISINPISKLPWLDLGMDYLFPDYTRGTLVAI